jgi:hypothetical protein
MMHQASPDFQYTAGTVLGPSTGTSGPGTLLPVIIVLCTGTSSGTALVL